MSVLPPNYPEENVVRGENVPNFKVNTSEGTSASNVFQILQDLQLKQYQDRCHLNTMHSNSKTFHTVPHNTVPNMAQLATSFRTTTLSTAMTGTMTMTTKQVNPVHAIQILHVRHHWDIVHMSTNQQFRFVNQVNR